MRQKRSAHRRRRRTSPLYWLGWAFLGVMLVAAVAAVVLLLPGREKSGPAPAPTATPAISGPGSAFAVDETAPPLVLADGTGGRAVFIREFRCDFTPPESLTLGTLRDVDLSRLGDTVAANAASSGWGTLVWTVTETGSLLLRAGEQTALTGDAFQRQEEFLQSKQPENLARTFLDNAKLIPLLREYGLTLSTQAENDGGMIVFRGVGDAPQTECSVRFSFLYTGAFNQAVVRAVYLDGAVTTDQVLPPKKAADKAVTWSSANTGGAVVTGCEIRPIRGLPFYVFSCEDGTVAYALAVDESVLGQVPGAEAVYREMMTEGIQEYVSVPGAGY